LFRAIECTRPPQKRIVNDGIARHFLPLPFRLAALLSRNSLWATVLCRYIDYRWPGSRSSLIARTRLIDEYTTSALGTGVRQVVLLGAGFDSRAYRTAGAERACFFEVDHPNTLTAKKERIRGVLRKLPEHVRYVAVNFQHDSVRESLEAAGFDPARRSLFIWEGVSNYLTEDAVRCTLAFIGGLAEGTVLVFTYVDEAVLRQPTNFAGGSEVQKTIARLEEPWTFGIRPDRTSEFLREYGLHLDSDLSAADYRKQYYQTTAPIRGYEFYHVVRAHVSRRAELLSAEPGSEAHDA
jgi:methyltransferase (TIGR00027 family)